MEGCYLLRGLLNCRHDVLRVYSYFDIRIKQDVGGSGREGSGVSLRTRSILADSFFYKAIILYFTFLLYTSI